MISDSGTVWWAFLSTAMREGAEAAVRYAVGAESSAACHCRVQGAVGKGGDRRELS